MSGHYSSRDLAVREIICKYRPVSSSVLGVLWVTSNPQPSHPGLFYFNNRLDETPRVDTEQASTVRVVVLRSVVDRAASTSVLARLQRSRPAYLDAIVDGIVPVWSTLTLVFVCFRSRSVCKYSHHTQCTYAVHAQGLAGKRLQHRLIRSWLLQRAPTDFND